MTVESTSKVIRRSKQVVADLHHVLHVVAEDVDYEENERKAVAAVSAAEAATKKALSFQEKYGAVMKSLVKLPATMAAGTLDALKDLSDKTGIAVKEAAAAWEAAEKDSAVSERATAHMKKIRGMYHYTGGEFMQVASEGVSIVRRWGKPLHEAVDPKVESKWTAMSPAERENLLKTVVAPKQAKTLSTSSYKDLMKSLQYIDQSGEVGTVKDFLAAMKK